MTRTARSSVTLTGAFFGFLLLGALLFALVTVFLVLDRVRVLQDAALEEAVFVRGSHAADVYANAINQDWRDLTVIADDLALDDLGTLRAGLDTVVGEGDRVSWAGFAQTNGRVIAAANDLLIGADVSSRPWFQRGLDGDFAGDVHEAILLNQLLGGSEEEPIRFLDLARNITGPDGQVLGVLGFHINFNWAEDTLERLARGLELDLFLVSQSGEVIIATDGSEPGALNLQSLRAAATGVTSIGLEQWPDGNEYFTTVVPDVIAGDLPSFGWKMVARISPETYAAAMRSLSTGIILVLLGTAFLLFAMAFVFARIFLKPLSALALNAERIAGGADEYPLELRSTDEAARLSGALAELQTQKLR